MNKLNLSNRLSDRIHKNDIQEIIQQIQAQNNKAIITTLYRLIFDTDRRTSGNAAWILTHLNAKQSKYLYSKQNELIREAIQTTNTSKRRLILTLLSKQPFDKKKVTITFLEFCFHHITSVKESIGIKALCMKLAYKQCIDFPLLLKELQMTLELMDSHQLSPGLLVVRKKILKDIQRELKND